MDITVPIKDWYGLHFGFDLVLNPGYTALAGPNGAGKTTLLQQIAEWAEVNNIQVWNYSNLTHGGDIAQAEFAFHGNIGEMARCATSSEGENVAMNFSAKVKDLGAEVSKARNGKYPLIVLLDAIDSGASIDRARELRHLFSLIEKDAASGVDIYLVVAANHYELVKAPADCVNVRTGEHLSFENYDRYADFICGFEDSYPRTKEE